MSVSISGSNAISGLGGQDTDFDKVLSQLKKIEQTQLNRLEAWKSDWNLRYEAFTQIIEQIQAASSMLSQLSDKNNFVTKLVQSTNDGVITAVANAAAQDVQHSIKVSQVASNAIWANTGHVFDSKQDLINTTGEPQYFSYTYAGKRHDFKVPANTTLESFASMINNSSDNPGIKVSLINTGSGYVFQVAGKDTGAANDLVIHDSKLVGMDSKGASSTWQTNSALDISDQLTNPTSYVFDLVLQGGQKKSVTIKGDATVEQIEQQLNAAAGGIKASIDRTTGALTIDGVQSFSRRKAGEEAYTPASTKVTVKGEMKDKLNATGGFADGLKDDDLINFTITLDDGTTRDVQVKAGATKQEMFTAIGQATQGAGMTIGFDNGVWSANLAGVKDVQFAVDGSASDPSVALNANSAFSFEEIAATGVKDTLGAVLDKATTTLTFDKDALSKRIDGQADGAEAKDLVFTVVKKDGTAVNITGLNGGKTNQEMLDHLKTELTNAGITWEYKDTDDKGNPLDNPILVLEDVKSFDLSSGALKTAGYTSEVKTSMTVAATNAKPGANSTGDLFVVDNGTFLLEQAPDLEYTITTNDGKTGVLKLKSPQTMENVIKALQDTKSGDWTWTELDEDKKVVKTTPPDDLGIKFVDKDGKEYVDEDGNPLALDAIDGPLYLSFKDITNASGVGISGQVSSSTNWSIQRAANARYQVDNWPVEMESATNSISDAIEGVVFTIQDEGTARLSVSTDITSVEQSIQNFLDAVNSVLLTVNELMKYDETKEVTSNDPNDIGNENYSPSGLTSQKGALLQGNYGVQLFKSRFSSMLGTTPPGFKSRQSADDILSGDVLASLANLGIKTDTDTTSDTYGLLVLAPSSSIAELQTMDKENYNNMITNNLEAVVDFFCASGSGSSTSSYFRYGSHVEGITAAGTYEVTYSVDDDGNITKVMIGGQEAIRDESQPGNYYSVASGDARGLSILIDYVEPGEHPKPGEDPMYVRIKQGLVQTTNNFLKAELVFNDVNIPANATPEEVADAVALKSKNGALMSLRDNYMTIMEGIDAKIEREQRRISTWEARQKAIFANLETLLKQYEQQQSSLEAQLKQLSGNS